MSQPNIFYQTTSLSSEKTNICLLYIGGEQKKGANTGNRASKPTRLQDRPGNAGKLEVRRIKHNYPALHCIADYTPLVLNIPLPSSGILLTALLVGWNQTAVIDVDLSSVFHFEASQSLIVRPAVVRTMLYHSIG